MPVSLLCIKPATKIEKNDVASRKGMVNFIISIILPKCGSENILGISTRSIAERPMYMVVNANDIPMHISTACDQWCALPVNTRRFSS